MSGIEPLTCRLQVARLTAPWPLPALTSRCTDQNAQNGLAITVLSFHVSFHAYLEFDSSTVTLCARRDDAVAWTSPGRLRRSARSTTPCGSIRNTVLPEARVDTHRRSPRSSRGLDDRTRGDQRRAPTEWRSRPGHPALSWAERVGHAGDGRHGLARRASRLRVGFSRAEGCRSRALAGSGIRSGLGSRDNQVLACLHLPRQACSVCPDRRAGDAALDYRRGRSGVLIWERTRLG